MLAPRPALAAGTDNARRVRCFAEIEEAEVDLALGDQRLALRQAGGELGLPLDGLGEPEVREHLLRIGAAQFAGARIAIRDRLTLMRVFIEQLRRPQSWCRR